MKKWQLVLLGVCVIVGGLVIGFFIFDSVVDLFNPVEVNSAGGGDTRVISEDKPLPEQVVCNDTRIETVCFISYQVEENGICIWERGEEVPCKGVERHLFD